jgi:hypothetical protein
MIDRSMNKVFLMALSEPEYARLDYWIAEQKKSKYSKEVFFKMMLDAFHHYESQIDMKDAEARAYNPDAEIAHRIPLIYETDHELSGHIGKSELLSLLLSIQKLSNIWYPDNDKSDNEINNIQPIHWLEKEESLRLFLQSIKKEGLIENRDTEEIIQEHFRQTDKKPQPIHWRKSNRLLIYLFNKLSEAGRVDTMGRQFQLITEHFLDKNGQSFKRDSLKQDNQNMKYSSDPRGSKTIDSIID